MERYEYEEVVIFGIPMLYTEERIPFTALDDVLCKFAKYELRGSDYNPDKPICLERNVVANFVATVFSPVEVPFLQNQGFLYINTLEHMGNKMTGDEFFSMWGDLDKYSHPHEVLQNNILQNNEKVVYSANDGCGDNDIFAIYQTDGQSPYIFMGTDHLKREGLVPRAVDYRMVYGGKLKEDENLDNLYREFNVSKPDDFRGHSLSISDIIVTNKEGKPEAWYVDVIGYTQLHDFIRERMDIIEAEENIESHVHGIIDPDTNIDFSDLGHIRVARGESEDGYKVETFISLVSNRIEKYLCGKEVARGAYPTMTGLIKDFQNMNYEDLTEIDQSDIDCYEGAKNCECRKAVEEAIDSGFDTKTFCLSEECLEPVFSEFEFRRIEMVLALTIRRKNYDGRFSRENREWAERITAHMTDNEVRNTVCLSNCEIESHPAILDGFVRLARSRIELLRDIAHEEGIK